MLCKAAPAQRTYGISYYHIRTFVSPFFIPERFFPTNTKKRHLDSHRSTVTTQTQNKTRQNYYAIFLLCRGGISCLTYLYSHTHKKLYQAICIINNAPIRILFTRVLKKMKLRRLFNKKNGTPIHIAAPSQHKHKIKHDKTTMQSSCYAGEAYLA